jgi:hypothetical protein
MDSDSVGETIGFGRHRPPTHTPRPRPRREAGVNMRRPSTPGDR